jgi:hypothetical protein
MTAVQQYSSRSFPLWQSPLASFPGSPATPSPKIPGHSLSKEHISLYLSLSLSRSCSLSLARTRALPLALSLSGPLSLSLSL